MAISKEDLAVLMEAAVRAAMAAGLRGSGGGNGGGGSKEVLYGKGLEMIDKFSGGETVWNEWSGDFGTIVQTKSEVAGEALIYVKVAGMAEKEVMDWKEVVKSKRMMRRIRRKMSWIRKSRLEIR